MIRLPSLLAIVWFLNSAEPLKVTTHLMPGPYFVGQAIEIRAEVVGAGDSVVFETPKSVLAEIKALAIDPKQPSSGRFVVIPRRAGTLEIPPFRAKAGDRSGVSRSSRLTVAGIPGDGRSAAFLGGVGAFKVKSEAEPSTLRAGQTLEFRIKITGQAAWASDRSPDLSSWKTLGGGLRIENLPDSLETVDPPIRTFRYRIRTKVAGRVILPPVSVASFEPKIGRFETRTTSSLAITAEKPPTLDPSTLDYRPILIDGNTRWGYDAVGLGVGLAGMATLALWFLARRKRRPRPANPSRLAMELVRNLRGGSDLEAARLVVDALTSYLECVGDRKPGVLTPPEAHQAFERLTQDSELARFAERLVIACDRAQYRGGFSAGVGLAEEGRAFFERLGQLMGRKKGVEGPREAVETA